MQIKRVHIYDSVDAMMERLSQAVIRIAQESICRHGRFDMVLSGGNTPQKLYALLARQSADWSKWHIWFGDERCLAPEDSQRNSYMAAQIWLHRVAIPKVNLHVIPAELGREGAEVYAKLLSEVHEFDLTLLGLGEDGHTASLFPENAAFLKDSDLTQFVANSPKPPSDRITM
ncbi:MAG: 6-phosphogluconolactonase, partial [Pseudomonadota bacterium]|nr:6-phosphogluconolactonase [Pseudomonadota bacterium]